VQSVNLIADARFSDDKATALHAIKTDQLLVDGLYFKAGQSTGWSKSPDADQAFLCVQGAGELVLETAAAGNELRVPLGNGAIALAPRGVFHQLVAGSQGMICAAFTRFPHRSLEKG
jgi:quercetin dioxygenase-like cupin family protein